MEYTLVKVAHVLNVQCIKDMNPIFNGVSIDSRTLQPGNLFVAIRGENFDGHDFVQNAKRAGAAAAIVSKTLDVDIPQLRVKDTCKALGELAADYRKNARIPLIAVTGSAGKTTTKNLIAAILEETYGKDKTLSSHGGLNNHYGLPLTLTRLTSMHRAAVVEMGMSHPGELGYLSRIACPDVAIITNAAPCHLEGVGSVKGVAKAKAEIFEGLSLQGQVALNRDDEYYQFWHDKLHSHRALSFGFHERADIRAENIQVTPRVSFDLITPMGRIDIELNLLGKHNIMNALAAVAATISLDIDLETIRRAFANVAAAQGRMSEHVFASGVRLIDDAYNASPASVEAALDVLALHQGGERVLVIGDMKELGAAGVTYHEEIGQYAKASGVHQLLAVGDLTRATCKAFGGRAVHFAGREDLLEALQVHLTAGTCVLVKGSFSMGMQDVVRQLLEQTNLEPAL